MKKSLFALIGISAMLLGSCAEVGPTPDEPPPADNTLRITYDVENHPGRSVNTRLAATDEEKTVQSLYLLFFEPTNDRSGEYIDVVKIENPQILTDNEIDMSNTLLSVTEAYNILAIANIEIDGAVQYLDKPSVDNWMTQWAGKTEHQVITEARAWTNADPGIEDDELLMSGSGKKAANSFRVDFTLMRNQIRYDVVNNASDYELVYVGLYNAYTMSKIWNDGSADGMLDYSEGMARIRNYYGYGGSQLTALKATGTGIVEDAVYGHFYTFENVVTDPEQNDNATTAVIIGLQKDGGATAYYRVNIAPHEGPQILYRNHAYVLTINSVLGEGHNIIDEAYNYPEDDGLNYIINQWGDNLIGVSDQDYNSMLSAPYKTIDLDLFSGEIRGHAEKGLSPNSIDITAVTSLPAGTYSDLDIIGEPVFHLNGSDDPYDGITVDIDHATSRLIFTEVRTAPTTPVAGQLESGDKITGSITIGFAGLRIVVDVVQTDLVKDFLNVYLPDGSIPRFAPFGGIKSEDIRVEASGSWKARIVSETPGAFGFDGTTDLEISRALEDKIFRVETKSNNNDSQKPREAFVIVTLDNDPTHYSKLIRLTQQQKAEIAITPSQSITFDGTFDDSVGGMADGMAGSLALVPNNTLSEFTVLSGTTGEGGTMQQNPWTYRIEVQNPTNNDLWEVAYIEDGVGNSPQGVQNAALNWFKITATHHTDPATPNTFKVDVLGKNTSGTTRTARIVAYIKGTNPADPLTARSSINLVQLSSGLSFAPSTVPTVPKIGGMSQAIAVQADASLQWRIETAEDFKTVSGANSRNKSLVHHEAKLLLENGQPVAFGQNYPITQKFKVQFPKIYYPNRDIPISATVKVSIVDAVGAPTELSSIMTVNQTTLTANTFNVWGMTGEQYDYGQLGNTYNRGWDGNSGTYGIKQGMLERARPTPTHRSIPLSTICMQRSTSGTPMPTITPGRSLKTISKAGTHGQYSSPRLRMASERSTTPTLHSGLMAIRPSFTAETATV